MKTIIALAKEKGVTVSDITNIILEWGRKARPDQKLNEAEVHIISKRLSNMPSENFVSYFGNTENMFKRVVQKVHLGDLPVINSHFNDDDAQKLCLRLFDKPTFLIAKQFSKERTNQELKYSIHRVAENSLEFYGGLLLSFVLNLKILTDATPETQIYKSDTNPDFSLRDLVFRDANNDELIITFRRVLALKQPSRFGFAISKMKTDGKRDLQYSFTNNWELLKSFINRIPPITLFYNSSNNGSNFYFGHSSSTCFICGKELIDPHSVIYGVGPTCRANFPLYFT